MKTSDIRGIIPPVITPMNNDPEQTVNHEELRKQEEAVAEMIYQTEDCKRGLTSLTENENGPMCEFLGR